MTVTLESVSLDDARRVIAAGEKRALDIGQPMNIAVVDAGGNLVAHARMDGVSGGDGKQDQTVAEAAAGAL